MAGSPEKSIPLEWSHPSQVMKLHKLKQKKKALQARIKGNTLSKTKSENISSPFEDIFTAKKRKNPFLRTSDPKKSRNESNVSFDESTDQTLFKLLHQSVPDPPKAPITSFDNILSKLNTNEVVEVVKAQGKSWLPIDWSLTNKVRLLSAKPFPFNQKLKISEEASGVTAFTRCLDKNTETTLDTSPNAKFHQCCLYWQQPSLPWLTLFPRSAAKSQLTASMVNSTMKDSLQQAWSDGLRSLFQLIRTRQCPYFYACANNFTVLFRAGGICGFTDVHAVISPTTRGFRHMLRQEDIEFTMPLKKKRISDQGYETLDSVKEEYDEEMEEAPDETWLKSMGINDDDIKQINYTQEKIIHKAECEVDNSEQSLIMVEGVEVHALYNFLINCKSAIATTGPLAGIPPTLLAPVAFHGASLNSLKVRENKVHLDEADYYSIELSGPILPSTIHNLFAINCPDSSLTATFSNIKSTECFSKLQNSVRKSDIVNKGSMVFGKENLSDCGLLPKVLKHFCAPDQNYVTNVECLKYTSEDKTYTWS
ncbi:humpty dumpty [Leptinotarsa decemlineata]|uniref:humpty dumpty n=1 Tax=Leptinotarsa decemlineata TaxID=7539 RepID=UPI000C25329F|nr:protein downstream neighbor of son homolog [Leptinotarsa decemlineata]